jgi:HK97 family phage portal protein
MGAIVESLRSITLGPFGVKDATLARYFGVRPSSTGEHVTAESASGSSVGYAAIALHGGSLAGASLHLYKRRADGGRDRFTEHPTDRVLQTPNPWITSVALRESIVASLMTSGWAVGEVVRDESARPTALWPLHPNAVTPVLDEDGQLYYRVTLDGRQRWLEPDDMYVVMGPHSIDGVFPVSPVQRARETLGIAQAGDRFAGTFFRNNGAPGGVLQHPGKLSTTALEHLKASWAEQHQGGDVAHRAAVLEEGMSWQTIAFNPSDSQILESRRFSAEELCRIFGNVPPSMLGVATQGAGLTYRSVEDEAIRYLAFSLQPIGRRIEAALNKALVSRLERRTQYIEFDYAPLLRTDLAARYAAYRTGKDGGWLSANDIRRRENLPLLPADQGGDTYTNGGQP